MCLQNFLHAALHPKAPVLLYMQAINPDYWPETTQRLAQLVKLHVHSMPGRHFGFLEHPEQAVDIIDSVLSGSAVP